MKPLIAVTAALAALLVAVPGASAQRSVPQGFFGVMYDHGIEKASDADQNEQWDLMASSGVETDASRLKYAAVVSLMRCGGVHAAMAPTASPRCASAFDSSGTDPCPATPLEVTVIARGIFSTVWMRANFMTPPVRVPPPPSA